MNIKLLYIDEFLIVCEKPVGVSSESPGLPDMIRKQEGFTVFPVHRLDRSTGGVCLLARSSSVCAQLQRLFQEDQILKEYLAVVSGAPKTDSGLFFDLLYHDQMANKTFVVNKQRKGVKKASCEWSLAETVNTEEGSLSLIRIRLHSGRTHQIRVQFASRQMPLVGDRRYGSGIKASSPALWSARICFPHPSESAKIVDVLSATPDIFPWSYFRFDENGAALRHL